MLHEEALNYKVVRDYNDEALFGESGVMILDYDIHINRFRDEFGSVIHDIYRLITPSQFMLFKQYKNQYLVRDITNSFLVELVYPE